MIHLEGMGVMGCLTAVAFFNEQIPFTWSDTDEEHKVSWKASTGAIPPFGDDASERCLNAWHELLQEPMWKRLLGPHVTRAVFCYVAQNPPHNAKRQGMEATHVIGPVKVSNRFSLHMDVQSMVLHVRDRFRAQRRDGPRKQDYTVVTHGFGENIYKWSWGWSAHCEAHFDDAIVEACAPDIPMLYGRMGYQLPYLYPVGATHGRSQRYYAGTTLVTQQAPKSLDPRPHMKTWRKHVEEYTDGLVTIERVIKGTLMEAWRPMANPEAELIERVDRRTVRIRPQYGNGIRMFPETLASLCETMEELV